MNELNSLFKIFSRYILIIPILILLGGLWIKFSPSETRKPLSIGVTSIPPSSPLTFPSPGSSTNAFNLIGPLYCSGTFKDGTYSVYIKDYQVTGALVSSQRRTEIRLQNDCGYIWETTQEKGVKLCGISTLLKLYNSFPLGSQMIGGSFLNGILAKNSGAALPANFDMQKMMDSCEKKVINSSFSLPTNIRFEEKKF